MRACVRECVRACLVRVQSNVTSASVSKRAWSSVSCIRTRTRACVRALQRQRSESSARRSSAKPDAGRACAEAAASAGTASQALSTGHCSSSSAQGRCNTVYDVAQCAANVIPASAGFGLAFLGLFFLPFEPAPFAAPVTCSRSSDTLISFGCQRTSILGAGREMAPYGTIAVARDRR